MIPATPPAIVCESPRAIDGDTVACANLGPHIRLAGIDAPEMPGHCRRGRVCTPGDPWAAQAALAALLARGRATVHPAGFDRYGRMLARIDAAGADVSCRMMAQGAAVARYTPLACAVTR